MMWRRFLVTGALIASSALAAAGASASGSATPYAASASHGTLNCTSVFTASIRTGPDSGQSLKGTLVFTVTPSGNVGGTLLARHNGAVNALPFTGTLAGRSFTLVLHGPSGTITGVGTAKNDVRTCGDIPRSGTLTGPHGDKGDWTTVKITVCVTTDLFGTICGSVSIAVD